MDIYLGLSNNFLCAFSLCIVQFIVLRQPLVELDQMWGTIVCATRVDKDDDTHFHEPLYTATKCLQLQKSSLQRVFCKAKQSLKLKSLTQLHLQAGIERKRVW